MSDENSKSCVVLVSGGLDSAVTAAIAKRRGLAVHALTVNYGQNHANEIDSAKNICAFLKVAEHKILDLDLGAFGGSALTSSVPVPKGPREENAALIPVTYVPARNTIFLSLCLAWAEVIGAYDIFIGVSSVDYSGYPDCREEYIRAFEKVANLGTKAAQGNFAYSIQAPLIHLSKAETILAGVKLGVDFSLTWTCYDPQANRPCGQCEACRFRAKGFKEAGLSDPAFEKYN